MSAPSPEDRQAAESYLREHLNLANDKVLDAIRAIYGDGYAAGMAAAVQQDQKVEGTPAASVAQSGGLSVGGLPTTDAQWQVWWDNWQPGNKQAAALFTGGTNPEDREHVLETPGLGQLLADAGVTIQGLSDTTISLLSTQLAYAAQTGMSVDATAKLLMEHVADPARAWLIADTETARAVSEATRDQYQADGVGYVDLLTSPGACPTCLSIAAGNPLRLDQAYVPVHPRCRCSLAPSEVAQPHNTSSFLSDTAAALAGALGVEEASGEASSEEASAREREAAEGSENEAPESVADVVPDYQLPLGLGENTGAGDTLLQENTGAGMTLMDENTGSGTTITGRNTGAGGSGFSSNQGGSGVSVNDVENSLQGNLQQAPNELTVQNESAPPPPPPPTPKVGTESASQTQLATSAKRTRKRTRQT